MAQKNNRRLIRNVRRDRQEGRDCPVHRFYPAIASSLISGAHESTPTERSYQMQVSASEATFAFDGASAAMMADLARTGFHSSSLPFSFSNMAIQIKRLFPALVAKQEQFCCGPRQGN
jgi:hypothetical protein